MATSLGELAARYGCELVGEPSIEVVRVATLSNAGPGALSFLANRAYRDLLANTTAAAVVLHENDADACPVAALVSDDPYLTYAHIARELHPDEPLVPGIHASAVVSPRASVAADAQVAEHASVGEETVVEASALIGPGVVVGPRCMLGAGTRVLANAGLVQDVSIGQRGIVHPGAVLGSDGFGNAQGDSGWVKVPQVGGVRIGDDVEIGANTTIDRGAIDDTVIGNGVRLDNLIQIAHNVQVGDHTAMAAFVGIAGSTTIGRRCMLAGRVGVVGHVSICDDVVVGGAAVVSKDITEPGFYTGSFTAEKDRDWKRRVARFRRLDDLVKRVAALEKGRHD